MSVSDRTVSQKKRRKIGTGDGLVWVAVVMIAVGAALCLAALLNL